MTKEKFFTRLVGAILAIAVAIVVIWICKSGFNEIIDKISSIQLE